MILRRSGVEGVDMEDIDYLVSRLEAETFLQVPREYFWKSSSKSKEDIKPRSSSYTRRQWFGPLLLQMEQWKSGTFRVSILSYNPKDSRNPMKQVLVAEGLSQFEADQCYEEAKEILKNG